MTTTTYEGPSRLEVLHQISKYNRNHHSIDRILISNIAPADLAAIKHLESSSSSRSTATTTTSDSTKQIDALITELEGLKSYSSQLRNSMAQGSRSSISSISSSSSSSRDDWTRVIAAAKKVLKLAEMEKKVGLCHAESTAQTTPAQARVQFQVPEQRVQGVNKTGLMEKEYQRKFIAEQKEIMAHLSAKKLEGEVRGFEKER